MYWRMRLSAAALRTICSYGVALPQTARERRPALYAHTSNIASVVMVLNHCTSTPRGASERPGVGARATMAARVRVGADHRGRLTRDYGNDHLRFERGWGQASISIQHRVDAHRQARQQRGLCHRAPSKHTMLATGPTLQAQHGDRLSLWVDDPILRDAGLGVIAALLDMVWLES